jgi:molybdenum cofactor biosynthesis enzyme
MLKSVERGARLTDIRLVEKSGGKTGTYTAE